MRLSVAKECEFLDGYVEEVLLENFFGDGDSDGAEIVLIVEFKLL